MAGIPVVRCEQCGQAMRRGSAFCARCGHRLGQTPNRTVENPPTSPIPSAPPPSARSGAWVRFALLCGGLGFFGGVLIFAPIALFGAAPAFWTSQMDYPESVRRQCRNLAFSCIAGALAGWFFLGGRGVCLLLWQMSQ